MCRMLLLPKDECLWVQVDTVACYEYPYRVRYRPLKITYDAGVVSVNHTLLLIESFTCEYEVLRVINCGSTRRQRVWFNAV